MIRYRFNAYGEKYNYKNDNNFKEILNYISDEIDLTTLSRGWKS